VKTFHNDCIDLLKELCLFSHMTIFFVDCYSPSTLAFSLYLLELSKRDALLNRFFATRISFPVVSECSLDINTFSCFTSFIFFLMRENNDKISFPINYFSDGSIGRKRYQTGWIRVQGTKAQGDRQTGQRCGIPLSATIPKLWRRGWWTRW